MTTKTLDVSIPFPSGRPDRGKLDRALRFLEHWPMRASCPLLAQEERWNAHPTYLCGSDQERAEELLGVWADPEQSVVWCGRGGYGATRLLSWLELALTMTEVAPTRFLGYSDITALFAFIRTTGLPIDCVHAPVVTEIPDHPQPETVWSALEGKPGPIPVEHAEISSGGFHGPIWGGNMAVLASLCGTPWLPQVESGAVFLEDIDEAPYRLDRFVTQLFDSGFFARAEGVFLGRFTKCGAGNAGLAAVKERLREFGLRVLGELPVGHEALHLPLFLDWPYRFDPTSSCLLPDPAPSR